MIFKSEVAATLLVVTSNLFLSDQIKSTEILDFTPFKSLLMLEMWVFAFTITFSALFDPIGIIICFLKSSLVVILSLGLPFWLILLMTL